MSVVKLNDYFTEEERQLRPGETEAERYERLNILLPDGRRLLGPPSPPVVPNRPKEYGGRE